MSHAPFARFQTKFHHDEPSVVGSPVLGGPDVNDERSTLFEVFAGASFNGGLYRVFTPERAQHYEGIVGEAFPEYAGKALCFGYDWLGRIFALNVASRGSAQLQTICLAIGTGEVLDIPANIVGFHEDVLVEWPDDAVAESFFYEWVQRNPGRLANDRCVGFDKPVFLGGADALENLSETDLEMYWELTGQIWQAVKGLPDGARIGRITLEP